jgi:anion-transporting  ArsA/GET3 family ATPase
VSGDAFRAHVHARHIAVCVGCGGVGKTTVAAALAFDAARAGRRALVITIDPARRLADALGVTLDNEPREIRSDRITGDGRLSAMMLDMKRTFDDLVVRFAEDEESRDRILANPIYQHVSDALSGSAEYSAMEKVYQLSLEGDFDFIVVDTPPAQNALDFLEAPQRLLEFLDSRLVHSLIHPAFAAGRLGFKIFQKGARRVLQLVERVSGMGFIEDVSEFLLAFEGMAEGFRSRASDVRGVLLGPETSFVLVTGPERESVHQAELFLDRLEAFGVPLAGVIANRVREWPDGPLPDQTPFDTAALEPLAEALAADASEEDFAADAAARAAVEAAAGYAALVRRDADALRSVQERARNANRHYRAVPEMDEDVHDLGGLERIAHYAFEREPEPEREREEPIGVAQP